MAVTPANIATALLLTAPASGSPEFAQWEMWIADALMLIEAKLGDPTALDQEKLDYVVREAVVAQVRRPDDATSVEVSVDDGRTAKRYSSGRGRVYIRDEWWDLLNPNAGKGGAFSLDMAPMAATIHAAWCALYFGADYCSCGADIAGYPIFEQG
ncbi:MAG TPA: hypothetical protein VFE45_06930 [Coriobacteriia bacterium]|nr:hypothetical protein [Coriobacteriia bacterium]